MTMPLEKIPPQSLEAEQAALGAMLLDSEATAIGARLLSREDFYLQRHQLVFAALTELYNKRLPVDLIIVGEYLKARDQLEQIGGTLALSTMMTNVPTAAGIKHYAGMVLDRARRRRLIHAADHAMSVAYDTSNDFTAQMVEVEASLLTIGESATRAASGPRHISEIMNGIYTHWDEAYETHEQGGFKSAWHGMNKLIRPLLPGQMIMLGGDPGSGKTALAVQWALDLATDPQKPLMVLVFSLEMTKEQLTLRGMLSRMSRTMDDLEAHNADALAEMAQSVEDLWDGRLFIDDTPALTVAKMDQAIRHFRRQHGVPDLVIVDYLQQAQPDTRKRSQSEEIGGMAYQLHDLAKNHQTVVLCLSQIVREVAGLDIKRPQMNHFFGGRMVEASSDYMMYVYRPGNYGPDEMRRVKLDWDIEWQRDIVEVGICKNRHGRVNGREMLIFDGEHYRFRDLTRDEWQSIRAFRDSVAAEKPKPARPRPEPRDYSEPKGRDV